MQRIGRLSSQIEGLVEVSIEVVLSINIYIDILITTALLLLILLKDLINLLFEHALGGLCKLADTQTVSATHA